MQTLQVMETGWAEGLRAPAVQVTGNGSHGDCEPQGNVFLRDSWVRPEAAYCLLSVGILNQSTEWDLQGATGSFRTESCSAWCLRPEGRTIFFFQKLMFYSNLIYKRSRNRIKGEICVWKSSRG